MILKTERLILCPWDETDAEQTVNGIRFTPMTVQSKRNGE